MLDQLKYDELEAKLILADQKTKISNIFGKSFIFTIWKAALYSKYYSFYFRQKTLQFKADISPMQLQEERLFDIYTPQPKTGRT